METWTMLVKWPLIFDDDKMAVTQVPGTNQNATLSMHERWHIGIFLIKLVDFGTRAILTRLYPIPLVRQEVETFRLILVFMCPNSVAS